MRPVQRTGLLVVAWFAVIGVASVSASCGDKRSGSPDDGFPDWWDTQPPADTGSATPDDAEDSQGPDTRRGRRDTSEPDVDTADLRIDGAPCDSGDQCGGGTCLQDPAWPSGYCTARPCAGDDECTGDQSECTSLNGATLCLRTCADDLGCRSGYWCDESADGGRCIPGTRPVPPKPDGAPCEIGRECAGGSCLTGENWPGGYCTVAPCVAWSDCRGAEDAVSICEFRSPLNLCLQTCESDEDCREIDGYTCAPSVSGVGTCLFTFVRPPTREVDVEAYPFPITCDVQVTDGKAAISFEVQPGTSAYAIVPFARDGRPVEPLTLTLPTSDTIAFEDEHFFQFVGSSLLGFAGPIIMPAIPSHESLVMEGEHTLTVRTQSEKLCWYLLEEAELGTSIDLNVYLVGLDGLDAESAPTDSALAEVFETMSNVYETAGVSVGEVRYFEVSADIVAWHRIIHTDAEMDTLIEQSDLPGDSYRDALSVNVFFVAGFAIPGAPGLLGIAAGIPGLPAIHSTRGSGVLLTAEYLREADGPQYTGVVLAHEVGHFLGLFHTSETSARHFDPLPDTPECTRGFPASCPDRLNLMFPYAASDHVELSEGQGWQIRVNPLSQ